MAHFAKIESGIVTQVLVIGNDDIIDENGDEQESLGVALCNQLYGEATWVQTSYNNNFRKQYAGSGYTWDESNNVFISSRPFPSWSLDENFDWQAPVAYPAGKNCVWDEDTTSWEEVV